MCHKTQSLKAALIWNFLKPNRRTCVHQPASSNASDSPLSSETQNLNETESELFIQFILNWILELLCSRTAHQPVRSNASDFSQTYDGDQTMEGIPCYSKLWRVYLAIQVWPLWTCLYKSVICARVNSDCSESWTTANEGCKNQSNRSIAAWMRPWSLCKWSGCRIHPQNTRTVRTITQ